MEKFFLSDAYNYYCRQVSLSAETLHAGAAEIETKPCDAGLKKIHHRGHREHRGFHREEKTLCAFLCVLCALCGEKFSCGTQSLIFSIIQPHNVQFFCLLYADRLHNTWP